MLFRKENVILREENAGRQKELLAKGFEKITEADLKPKKAKKEDKKGE